MRYLCLILMLNLLAFGTALAESDLKGGRETIATQWKEVELVFQASSVPANPYVDQEGWVEFIHDDGTTMRRPMFWNGGAEFCVRFSSPKRVGSWTWHSVAKPAVDGLDGIAGRLICRQNENAQTDFERHGFWHIPAGERNLVHDDGRSRLLCADTPWALPWRATLEQAEIYAKDRQQKGYNAALLMTVMPDVNTRGPRSRTEAMGFDVAFNDLAVGRLRDLNVAYFHSYDRLINVLIGNGIAPVHQPVFHGFGWKGGGTAGNLISPEDYARYCRYLVARYGARPAIWLIGGDGPATNQSIIDQLDRAGTEIETWDAYGQPTGIHYAPHGRNDVHQNKSWLDFQWCQTGHSGDHVPERVADMWRNRPIKAVANGEPTYENIGEMGKATGWWQGHEAWCNLTAGGTMGLVYGAASLWNWRLSATEPGHPDWCTAPDCGWREALDFEGAIYPGIAAGILNQYDVKGMRPDWSCTYGRRGLLIPDKLFVLYLPRGGSTAIISSDVPRSFRVYDPMTGSLIKSGELDSKRTAKVDCGIADKPMVVVFSNSVPHDRGSQL